MAEQYFELGSSLSSDRELQIESAIRSVKAICEHPDFELVECRVLGEDATTSEILVVDCKCDGIPTRNRLGLRYRERLGLRFFSDGDRLPEVRALRQEFPCTPHQNHVGKNEPASVCMYFEAWSEVRRTWTPQKHLARIQWWLAETANETLHREDQPVEPIYFDSRFGLVLPANFENQAEEADQALTTIPRDPGNGKDPIQCITLTLPKIVHGRIEQFPASLGDLHDQMAFRGAPIVQMMKEKLQEQADVVGINSSSNNFVLLVLRIPIARSHENEPEEVQVKGVIVHSNIGELGVECGALIPPHDGSKYYRDTAIGAGAPVEKMEWRDIAIEPLELLQPFTSRLARLASGLTSCGPRGVLAGVGALGSVIASIWQREAWGQWSYIDPDFLKPHNLARHTGFEFQIGLKKVDVVLQLGDCILQSEPSRGSGLYARATDFDNPKVRAELESADLVVDATTTLEVPRELAGRDSLKRVASVFVTPSGLDVVLMIEDARRETRIDCLEAQYYRAIINEQWGESHLLGNQKVLPIGAGCRDVSAVISNELISLHGATLARQIRLNFESPETSVRVWRCDAETGGVSSEIVVPKQVIKKQHNGLRIVWDEGIKHRVRGFRSKELPNETGGVLLGYFDLSNASVYLVDVLPEPPDSQGDRSGFTRGVDGLKDAVRQASERTRGIVGYIGEWHSHPSGSNARPSEADMYQMAHLASELHRDGLPALMLIVGEHEERWLVGEALS